MFCDFYFENLEAVMEFALNDNNEKTHASQADKKQNYYCPLCNGKVILRRGQINIEHFAHKNKCVDTWKYDMSEWHSQWQKQFPKKNQEVVIEFNGEKHRADVMACGYVIEFQHSPITAEEFSERNQFYLNYGKKVIWIFDVIDEYKSGRITCYGEWHRNNNNGGKYKWSYPKRFLENYLPQDNKDIIVFFQFTESIHSDIDEAYIERVIWAIEEYGFSNFKRFHTSYEPCNFLELLKSIKEHKL